MREYRKPIRPNIGVVIFGFIFIYILIYVMRYMYTDHIAIYEVIKSSISENNEFRGVIIRDEEVITAKEAGYVTYYSASGARVAKNDMVFSIDEGGSAFDQLSKDVESVELRDNDYKVIADEIEYNRSVYNDSEFYQSYTFKNDITNMVLELRTGVLYENMEDVIKDSSAKNVVIDKASDTGIISTTTDNMDKISVKNISEDLFNSKKLSRYTTSSGELLEKGADVYRLVKDDEWNIVIKINKKQYNKLKDKKTIGITFKRNNLDANANIKVKRKGNAYYGILTLYDYMVNFIDDRYVDLQLAFNKAVGLKIPNSAIIEKEFYVVPKKMFSVGGNSNSQGLLQKKYSRSGKESTEFIPTSIYYEKDDKCYIDKDLFEMGTKVVSAEGKSHELNNVDSLQGVYNVNKGYAEFRHIDVVYSSDEYTIVKENTGGEMDLAKYDHIVLDATDDIEDKIIH